MNMNMKNRLTLDKIFERFMIWILILYFKLGNRNIVKKENFFRPLNLLNISRKFILKFSQYL